MRAVEIIADYAPSGWDAVTLLLPAFWGALLAVISIRSRRRSWAALFLGAAMVFLVVFATASDAAERASARRGLRAYGRHMAERVAGAFPEFVETAEVSEVAVRKSDDTEACRWTGRFDITVREVGGATWRLSVVATRDRQTNKWWSEVAPGDLADGRRRGEK